MRNFICNTRTVTRDIKVRVELWQFVLGMLLMLGLSAPHDAAAQTPKVQTSISVPTNPNSANYERYYLKDGDQGTGEYLQNIHYGTTGNDFGISFYTAFKKRIDITNNGINIFNADSKNYSSIQAQPSAVVDGGGAYTTSLPTSALVLNAAGGNVGIGTTTPKQKLDVNGNVNALDFYLKGKPLAEVIDQMIGSRVQRSDSGPETITVRTTENGNTSTIVGTVVIAASETNKRSLSSLDLSHFKDHFTLFVDDGVVAEDYIVRLASEWNKKDWPDYVFEEDYQLKPLSEVEKFVNANKHLPGVPSRDEVDEKGGYSMPDLNLILLKKIEELTLHAIAQEKKIEEFTLRATSQERQIEELRKMVVSLSTK